MDANGQRRSALSCELVADVARSFGEVRLKATGASMLPAVWPGDIVTVRLRGMSELQPGQIVLCCREGKLVAHRISCVCEDHLITRGDILPHYDEPVYPSAIVGQVVCVLRNGRRIPTEQSFWQRACSSILRRSDSCTRMTLRLGRLRRPGTREMSWASYSLPPVKRW